MNEPEIPFFLTLEEKHSQLWGNLMRYWEKELNKLRISNDFPQDDLATATIRGKIAAIKNCMLLDNDKPTIDMPPLN